MSKIIVQFRNKSKNSSEIPKNIVLPESESKVIRSLLNLGKAPAPAISRASKEAISISSVYTLLARLKKKSVVSREEVAPSENVFYKNIFYRVSLNVSLFDAETKEQLKETALKTKGQLTVIKNE